MKKLIFVYLFSAFALIGTALAIAFQPPLAPLETRPGICVGLPNWAMWNTVPVITQYYTSWVRTPTTWWVYNTIPSTTQCRFKCQSGYNWNGNSCLIVVQLRIGMCVWLPSGAVWNTVSSITQYYNYASWIWLPNTWWVYNTIPSTTECRFKCQAWYVWSGNSCQFSSTRTGMCVGLPKFAVWNTVSSITQYYISWIWLPNTWWVYNTVPSTGECRFKCKSGYVWNGSACTWILIWRYAACMALPNFAVWNTATGIIQSMYYPNWIWTPPLTWVYNTIPSTGECRFVCQSGYVRSGNVCQWPTMMSGMCVWLPSNAMRNTVSSITQYYISWVWLPALTWIYNTTSSTTECRFVCQSGYVWNGNSCNMIRPGMCVWLPNQAVWNTVSVITQYNSGWWWSPTTWWVYNTSPSTTQCRFKCQPWYNWNGNSCQVTILLRQATCVWIPSNAMWNTVSMITQSYNFSNWTWSPTTWWVYNINPSITECRFKCQSGYVWSGGVCQWPAMLRPLNIKIFNSIK